MADGSGGDGTGQGTGDGASEAQAAAGSENSTQQNDGNQEGSVEAQAAEAQTAEVAEVEATKPPEKQSETDIKISKLFEQSKNWFPDQEFENEDAFSDHLIKDYNDKSEYKTKNLEANKKVLDVLKATPELGNIIKDVSKGVPFTVALATHVDMSKVQPQEGEADFEAYAKARDGRIAKVKESEDAQDVVSKNQEESKKIINTFFTEKKMDDGQVKEFADFVDGLFSKWDKGIIDNEMLSHFYNAKNYDTQVAQEKNISKIKAKNEQIDLKKKETKTGDGLPVVGQGVKTPEKAKEKGLLDDMFDKIEKKNNIYN